VTSRLSTGRKALYAGVCLLIVLAGLEGVLRVRAWMRYGNPAPTAVDPMLVYDAPADLMVPRQAIRSRETGSRLRSTVSAFAATTSRATSRPERLASPASARRRVDDVLL
jgi:hypothetical protein